jgi:hypothetical protein
MSSAANRSRLVLLFFLAAAVSAPGSGRAEIRTVSWNAVTTYTDGTPIEPSRTVRYDIFWSTDAGLSLASLRTVASSVSQTTAAFDPDALGMPRGQTVYLTGDAVLDTGEKSALASPYSWTVPAAEPGEAALPAPGNVSVSGPVATSPTKLFQLTWDPVTRREDGAPIPPDAVRYDAQWTADPSLPEDSWRSLGTSIASTSVNFDPGAAGMPANQRVYFTVKAKDALGGYSPPSGTASWVSNNPGPSSPRDGRILKR